MSLSSHVLDAVRGTPAARRRDPVGAPGRRRLGAGGRGRHRRRRPRLRLGAAPRRPVSHRLVFGSGDYFAAQGSTTFYPEVVVVFEVTDTGAHHHVPLLLSPFGYSTYRGS